MEPLKFVALDTDDLEVVADPSAGCRGQGRATCTGARRKSAWCSASTASTGRPGNASSPQLRRRRAALRFDRVLACKCKEVKPDGKDAVLNLLAVEFEPTDAPGRRRDADLLRAAPCCGSKSSAWRSNWPTSARPGPPTCGRNTAMTDARRGYPQRSGRSARRTDAQRAHDRHLPFFGDGCLMKGPCRSASIPEPPISRKNSAPSSTPSARPPPTSRRPSAPSSRTWSPAATTRWSS